MSGSVHPLFPDGSPRAARAAAPSARANPESDEVLLARVARGDSAGHRLLFDRYQARVTGFLRRRLADAGLCDEVVSDVFFEVWRSASAWRGESSVASWIFGIAHFKALSARRGLSQGKRAAVVPMADEWIERAADDGIEDSLVARDEVRSLLRALQALPAGRTRRAEARLPGGPQLPGGRDRSRHQRGQREDARQPGARAAARPDGAPEGRHMTLMHETGCPEDVLAAIAWYPDGLDAERRGAVEAHAADCSVCREEISFLRSESAPQAPPAESERVYARVLERIDAYESRARGVERRVRSRAARVALRARAGGRGRGRRRRRRRALDGLGSRVLSQEPIYHAAGAPVEVASAQPGLALDVVFRPDARPSGFRPRCARSGARSSRGRRSSASNSTLRLAASAGTRAAAAQALREEKGRGVASFAEPAPPPAG